SPLPSPRHPRYSPPMETQPAASAILLRAAPSGPPELLITERSQHMRFAAGAWVFPGGRVDPADHATAQDPRLASHAGGLDPIDAAARIAALRETFEETGLLLTTGPRPAATAQANARNALSQGPDRAEACTFAALLAGLDHHADLSILHPFAQWEPAIEARVTRRFRARFYLVDVTGHDTTALTADGQEATALHWITAADLLAGHIEALVFPTRCLAARIAQYPDIEALLASAARHGDALIQPRFSQRDGETWVSIPDGMDYPHVEAPLATLRCT
ncbi:NUDIX domain-containing protein, partial [Polymorphobacter sp.]|uniref:NUDIX domain-containing protein n=1 Tax=Polymorphobacter sp. TaxID=1909290 RepID=UPI003F6F46B7